MALFVIMVTKWNLISGFNFTIKKRFLFVLIYVIYLEVSKGCSRKCPQGGVGGSFFGTPPPPRHTFFRRPPYPGHVFLKMPPYPGHVFVN